MVSGRIAGAVAVPVTPATAAPAKAEPRRATRWLDRPFAATGAVARVMPIARQDQRPAARNDLRDSDAALQVAAFDDLSLAAIACDPCGRILARSAAAAPIVDAGEILASSAGRLIATDAHDHARLRAALVHCSTADAGSNGGANGGDGDTITLAMMRRDGLPTRLDLAPLRNVPGGCIILVTENRPCGQATQQLVTAFGLTRAEAEVAIDLVHGLSARDIATRRSASSDTVRKQTQAIFQKLGVSKATRLSYVIGPFLR